MHGYPPSEPKTRADDRRANPVRANGRYVDPECADARLKAFEEVDRVVYGTIRGRRERLGLATQSV